MGYPTLTDTRGEINVEKRPKSDITIGIDLGTTCSCVGIWKDGGVKIIENKQGWKTMPSFVAFKGNDRIIGDSAKSGMISNSKNTVFDAKRLIGRKFSDPIV